MKASSEQKTCEVWDNSHQSREGTPRNLIQLQNLVSVTTGSPLVLATHTWPLLHSHMTSLLDHVIIWGHVPLHAIINGSCDHVGLTWPYRPSLLGHMIRWIMWYHVEHYGSPVIGRVTCPLYLVMWSHGVCNHAGAHYLPWHHYCVMWSLAVVKVTQKVGSRCNQQKDSISNIYTTLFDWRVLPRILNGALRPTTLYFFLITANQT